MLTNVYKKEVEDLYKTPVVQQTSFWSLVKKKQGASPIAIDFKSRESDLFANVEYDRYIYSDFLVIVRHLSSDMSVAYVPYGPELEPDEQYQGVFLEEISECIRPFLPKTCILIRYDLSWESYWANDPDCYDENGIFQELPDTNLQNLRFNCNTINWNFQKAQFNILPSSTIYINLQDDLNTILMRMKPKTRYNIHLSQRKGVVVRSMGMESLDVWYELYKETAMRNGLYLNDIRYFETVFSSRSCKGLSSADVHLLLAEYEGKPIAAMFLIITGKRGSYLYGASSSANRNCMATYALQWEAIKMSKAMGCNEYDMFGVSPGPDASHPLYGLYKFKIGFGGRMHHGLGCWDYPLDQEKYNCFRGMEINGKGFHVR